MCHRLPPERTNEHLTEINDLNRTYNDNLDLLVEHSDHFPGHMCNSLNLTKFPTTVELGKVDPVDLPYLFNAFYHGKNEPWQIRIHRQSRTFFEAPLSVCFLY